MAVGVEPDDSPEPSAVSHVVTYLETPMLTITHIHRVVFESVFFGRKLHAQIYDAPKRDLQLAGIIACANGKWYVRQGGREKFEALNKNR
jgi:hypothetical protein